MIFIDPPNQQIEFAERLLKIRSSHLQDALLATVRSLDIRIIDNELSQFAPKDDMSLLASKSLRAEIVFAVPEILKKNPQLLGYYRLLLGHSQKAFYQSMQGLGLFKAMEDRNVCSAKALASLPDLCHGLNHSLSILVNSLSENMLNKRFLDDLTLISLGPQLRGGANVKIGEQGIMDVFKAIRDIVGKNVVAETEISIEIKNAANRIVRIEFSPDPDIVIKSRTSVKTEDQLKLVAIEVKGGRDVSNIHNRIGEAEKSHQKARKDGFPECWTIVNVRTLDQRKARAESPSTNHFFNLKELKAGQGKSFVDFRNRLRSVTGIK